ncbi:MAG: hemin uptake protein HemP [Pseudomonadales bacterium]|nr:hemin uptake protein HemP [Pseudomonadales bacterium]
MNNSSGKKPATERRQVTVVDNCVSAGDLLAGNKELLIRHKEESYRLRMTGNDKLILTK